VRVGAAAAALGALLALIAGVGRTALAMARERDLPGWLAAVHPRHRVPHHAEASLAAVVCVLVLTVDLRGAIGFSSFGVLLHYLVPNVAALTQARDHRRFPQAPQVLGAAGCALLVVTLPPASVAAGPASSRSGSAADCGGCRPPRPRPEQDAAPWRTAHPTGPPSLDRDQGITQCVASVVG
jgi:APA family basic amino acid/polyamine antiporter